MGLFNSSNPTLSEKTLRRSLDAVGGDAMTAMGALYKFGFLLLMVLGASVYTWKAVSGGQNVTMLMMGGVLVGFVLSLVIVFRRQWAPYLAPAYAIAEGLFIGGLSAMMSDAFAETAPFIVQQAVLLTFSTAIVMFLLYRFRIIRVTQQFRSVIISATLGIAVFYLLAMVLGFFNIHIAFLHEGSMIGILFSIAVVAIAALNLLLDFDMIEQGESMGAPAYMEWYCAFALMVTIVWLYIEILRLLSKLYRRN